MKRMASFLIVLAVCVQVSAETYLLECTEYGYVYNSSDVLLDTSKTNVSITLDVITEGEASEKTRELKKGDKPKRMLRLSIKDVKVDFIKEGESYLARAPEATAALNDLRKNLELIRRQEFVLTSTGELIITTHDNKKVSTDSWDIIQELWQQFMKAGVHATIMMPADYLRRVPWLVDVPEDMRPAESLTVPFRKPLRNKTSFSSQERTTNLVCTLRTGNILKLESNREKHRNDRMLTWHVQVDYDTQEHLPIKITENRFSKLVGPRDGNIHTVREEITLRPLQSKKPLPVSKRK